jgi:glycosyltransferase involved in cell wall biosynthesis
MKIIHSINYFQPQLGYQEYFLAKEHAKLGHEVHVVTSERYFPFENYNSTTKPLLGERIGLARDEFQDGFQIHRLNVKLEKNASVKLIGYTNLIETIKPDLVIHHGVTGNYLINEIVKCQKKLGFKLLCDNHMHYCAETNRKKIGLFKDYFMYKISYFFLWKRRVHKFIAYSEDVADYLNMRNYIPRSHISIIPLGVDVSLFSPDENIRNRTRSELKIKTDEILLIYTGKLIQSKDPLLIIMAAQDYAERYKLRFLFVGNFSTQYQKRFLEETNLIKHKIILIPAVKNPDLPKYYNAADIAIWPKQASMAMLEAASCGLPIAIPDITKDRVANNNGVFFKEGDLDEVKSSLFHLLQNQNMLKEMGNQGRKYVQKEYGWESIAQKFIQI